MSDSHDHETCWDFEALGKENISNGNGSFLCKHQHESSITFGWKLCFPLTNEDIFITNWCREGTNWCREIQQNTGNEVSDAGSKGFNRPKDAILLLSLLLPLVQQGLQATGRRGWILNGRKTQQSLPHLNKSLPSPLLPPLSPSLIYLQSCPFIF